MKSSSTLVATLGGQPQIVTFTLDLLRSRCEVIDQVVIVYLASSPRYSQAYRLLMGEFIGDRYDDDACHLRSVPIYLMDDRLSDARTPQEVDAVWKTFYQIFADLKSQGQRIHLSLTGGRRIMALLAFSVGMLLFDSADRVWHLHTPEDVVEQAYEGALMHVPPDSGVHLIEVPLVPWGTVFPGIKTLLGFSPQDIRAAYPSLLDETEWNCCQQVWESITRRQQDALRVIASGLDRQRAADKLNIAITTLDDHKTGILQECRKTWDTNAKLDIHFLRRKFKPFLSGIGEL